MKTTKNQEVDVDDFSQLVSQNTPPEVIMALLEINKTKLKELSSQISMRFDPESSRWVRKLHQLGYFKWQNLESGVNTPYKFPDDPTSFMSQLLEISAIYRWIVRDHSTEAVECMYIGQTSNLLKRLKSYLYRDDQRVGIAMHKYAKNPKYRVTIQVMSMSKRGIFDGIFSPLFDINSLSDRIFIESKIISYYEAQGYELLNILKDIKF